MSGGGRCKLTLVAWRRAVVLAFLARSGLPLSTQQLGAALGTDHTTLNQALFRLQALGAVEAEPLPDTGRGKRQSVYRAARIVRLATA